MDFDGKEGEEKNLFDQIMKSCQSKIQKDLIQSLYKNVLMNFISDWKCLSNENVNKSDSENLKNKIDEEFENELIHQEESLNSCNFKNKEGNNFENNKVYEIIFTNKNVYSGEIKDDMLDGQGSYFWRHGAQYKGEFKENRIEGKGHFIWKDNCSWYEGEFLNSMRHGKGTVTNKEFSLFYTGFWYNDFKHGSGFCSYGERNNYEGMWVMGKKEGKGYRVYPSGSVYEGQWKNDLRHGFGIMVWPNGDIFRGEWRFGQIHGHGEYTWRSYFNKTLSWPQENSYIGQWHQGLRHGKGLLRLNSSGGAKYSGMWKNDKKHGYGILRGNDGSSLEKDPLFLDDILKIEKETDKLEETDEFKKTDFVKKPYKLLEPVEVNHLNPEQWPLLSKFIKHLSIPRNETDDLNEDKQKCTKCQCLSETVNKDTTQNVLDYTINQNIEKKKNSIAREEINLRNTLTKHMPCLRKIYEIYTKLYCFNEKLSPRLSMSRMSLWQLWRDCGIHKSIGLIEIDNLIAASGPKIFIETEYGPFERIERWQFIFALLEISWELYSKYKTSEVDCRLSDGFCKLLDLDIFPNAGNHYGKIFDFGVDFLPLSAIYQLYKKVGEPHSVRKLFKAVFDSDSPAKNVETSIRVFEGKNVRIGEKVSFLPNRTSLLFPQSLDSEKEIPNNRDLSSFRELRPAKFLSIISEVCPSIKDQELNSIINIDYELTFLEFYEILLEATVVLLKKQKQKKKLQESKKEADENILPVPSQTSIVTRKSDKINLKKKRKRKI